MGSSLKSHLNEVRDVFRRNRRILGIVAIAFFSMLFAAAALSYLVFRTSPQLAAFITDLIETQRGLIGNLKPGTVEFYRLIFLNNIGHYWNPARAWVWIPLMGAFGLGYELILNAVLIGVVASFAATSRGVAFTIAALAPHGIFELPAFILEFAALARWHIAASRAVYAKISGRQVDRPLLVQGLKDTLVLSVVSVALFAFAAYVETWVTTKLIGL